MRPYDGFISLWPVMIIIMLIVLGMFSYTSNTHLKPAAPADFAALPVTGHAPNAALAARYWSVATRVVQWKYNRGTALPDQPPAEFRLPGEAEPTLTQQEMDVRGAYWAKLRQEWLLPDNWRTTYGVDFKWALRDIRVLTNDVLNFMHQS